MYLSRIILTMFITVAQLLHYAKAQNEVITEYEGIFFYYETDSIPQDVFLLPCKIEYQGFFSNFLIDKLKNHKGELIEIYFQGMRWGMPSLTKVIKEMSYYPCSRIAGNGSNIKMRLCIGKIFCNATYIKESEHPPSKEDFLLEIGGKRYSFISNDFESYKMGTPVFFEPFMIN